MKILVICNKSPYPPHDGGSLASYNLISSLCRTGHELTLLTMCTPKHGLSDTDKTKLSELVRLYTLDVDTSIRVFRVVSNLIFSSLPYNAVRFISRNFDSGLAGILQAGSFDIVQLEGLYLMPYVDTIRRYSAARIVLRAHNVEQEIWFRIAGNESNLLKKYYFTIMAKRLAKFEISALNRYDLLVPITSRDLDEFNRMGNRKPVHVCPASLDMDPLTLTEPTQGFPSLFFLGSLDWKPNQEGLLWFVDEVFPKLLPRYTRLIFHVAGRNAPAWLKSRIESRGIVFHGEIPEAGAFISDHGILVAPCFSGGGMRVKIIEAMAYAKPVVTTPVGAEGLATTHNENILICNSVDEYVENLDSLLKFPDFYRKIAINARGFVRQHFDNMKISSALSIFYETYLP
jgi:polysaccharide biosynthesis protein PslH